MPSVGVPRVGHILDGEFNHRLDHVSDGVATPSPTERPIPRHTGRQATGLSFKEVGDPRNNYCTL